MGEGGSEDTVFALTPAFLDGISFGIAAGKPADSYVFAVLVEVVLYSFFCAVVGGFIEV